jgi:hypothetical protein
LEQPDLDRLFQKGILDARSFTQFAGRADTSARRPNRIGIEDNARRSMEVIRRDLFDKGRNINMGRTSTGTRRVIAVQASLSFNNGLRLCQGGRDLGEVPLDLFRGGKIFLFTH